MWLTSLGFDSLVDLCLAGDWFPACVFCFDCALGLMISFLDLALVKVFICFMFIIWIIGGCCWLVDLWFVVDWLELFGLGLLVFRFCGDELVVVGFGVMYFRFRLYFMRVGTDL